MHYQFLVEDYSGEVLIKHVMNKICYKNQEVTYNCKFFKGIGGFSRESSIKDVKTNKLLNDLLIYLRGFNKSLQHMKATIIIVLDNDKRDTQEFKNQLYKQASMAMISTDYVFCIAVEEMEAWLLGDKDALLKAYPNARESVINSYIQDSICGTWECMANALFKGGLAKFRKECPTYREVGKYKAEWADSIGQYMDIEKNVSPSFKEFVEAVISRIKIA